MFVRDEIAIPAKWIPAEERAVGAEQLLFSQLSLRYQRKLRDLPIAVYETRLTTEAEEAELFTLLNFAGTALQPR